MSALLQLLRRRPDYARLFFAAVISLAGDWFAFVAVSGMLVESTGHEGVPAFIYAASVLPIFVLAPIAGVIADRVDRRRMLIWADLLRVPIALLYLGAAAWDSPGLAIGCALALAAMSTFSDPIYAVAIANVVEPDELPLANAAASGVWGAMLLVGAGLGGLVTALAGREVAFIVNAASFAVSALLVWRIRLPLQQRLGARATPVWRDLGELWQFLRDRPVVARLLGSKPGIGVGNGIVGLLPSLSHGRFGAGDFGAGLLLAARGLGALVGSAVAARVLAGAPSNARLLRWCGWTMLIYALAYAVFAEVTWLVPALVLVWIAHIGGGAQWVISTHGLQLAVPDAMRGRVMSFDYGLATLAIGLSSVAAGILAELIGIVATIWVLCGVVLAYHLVWTWWSRRLAPALADTPADQK